MKVVYGDWICTVRFAKYANRRIAMVLVGAEHGDQIDVATVNLPDEVIPPDFVFINAHYEGNQFAAPTAVRCTKNPGMVESLVKAGVIEPPLFYTRSGFVLIPCCKLLIDPHQKDA